MSNTLVLIKQFVESGDVRISEHGYDELANDHLTAREIVRGIESAIIIEDYPDFPKGASDLVLQTDKNYTPIHASMGHTERSR